MFRDCRLEQLCIVQRDFRVKSVMPRVWTLSRIHGLISCFLGLHIDWSVSICYQTLPGRQAGFVNNMTD